MIYSEIREQVLTLLDRLSVAGSDISPAYNGQSDLLRRIPGLVSDGVARVRLAHPLPGQQALTGGEAVGDYLRYELPQDFGRLQSAPVRTDQGRQEQDWQRVGRCMLVPPGDYTLHYWQKPLRLPREPEESAEYGEDESVIRLGCYYAAAVLASGEDVQLYQILMAEFRAGLEDQRELWCQSRAVEDVYGWEVGV